MARPLKRSAPTNPQSRLFGDWPMLE